MNTTHVKVTISTSIAPIDRIPFGNFLAKAFNEELDDPQNIENVSFTGHVSLDKFSELCDLEDMGILTIEQLAS